MLLKEILYRISESDIVEFQEEGGNQRMKVIINCKRVFI